MLNKTDLYPSVSAQSPAVHAPPASGAASERIMRARASTMPGADGVDRAEMFDEVAMDVHPADALVASTMESLLNRVHRNEKMRQVDAAFTLLLALKASGSFVYDHCVRLIELSMELTRELGLEGTEEEAETELGLIYRDCGEASYFLSKQHPEEQEALVAYLGGTDIAQKAMLHDVGKMEIPRHVLYKPGALNDDEIAIMRRHPLWGAAILQEIPSLAHAVPVTLHHHERWDGDGYPHRLAAENIPLSARIVCVVDAFDAMINDRPYRKALPVEEAVSEIRALAGTQFDPWIAAAFLQTIRR
ncbi:MAG: HD domain-containing protein [Armatimonadetes bacterium]|nr:HD domain-containing protein [Armatimonadota bacterium]